MATKVHLKLWPMVTKENNCHSLLQMVANSKHGKNMWEKEIHSVANACQTNNQARLSGCEPRLSSPLQKAPTGQPGGTAPDRLQPY